MRVEKREQLSLTEVVQVRGGEKTRGYYSAEIVAMEVPEEGSKGK